MSVRVPAACLLALAISSCRVCHVRHVRPIALSHQRRTACVQGTAIVRRLDGDTETGLRASASLHGDFVMRSEHEIYYVNNEAAVERLDITTDNRNICWAHVEVETGVRGYLKNQFLYPVGGGRGSRRACGT